MEHLSYPGESADYRAARNALLDAEMDLRRQIERVAEMRRALPPGGVVPQDYVFERIGADQRVEPVKLSELFEGKPSILIYSFMFGPERDRPCPGCTHLLDGLDGASRHVNQRLPFYVVAKSPIARLEAWAHQRGWDHLRLLSSAGNSYVSDYFGDTSRLTHAMRTERNHDLSRNFDEPIFNAFTRDGEAIRHSWGSELTYAPEEPGQHHRMGDLVDPLWNLFDMAPEGRGDFNAKLTY